MTAVTLHFDKYRHVAFGVATSGVGIGTLTCPIIAQELYETYGWQGCVLVIGGIAFHQVATSGTFPSKPLRSKAIPKKETPEQHIGALNLWIFKNIEYLLIGLSLIFYTAALVMIYVHLSAYAVEIGFSPIQGSLLYTTIGICCFLGRFVYLGILHWSNAPAVLLHMLGAFICGCACILLPFTNGYIALQIYAVVFGLCTSSIGSLVPLIMSDILGPTMIASAYGYAMVFSGVGQTSGGPLAGTVHSRYIKVTFPDSEELTKDIP